ncbi:MAG TPA: hypothetical protein VJN88_02025 [Ktedonobacterales bacterium]|nr:hypothetical protein [Ktedonobacterales bacterium]
MIERLQRALEHVDEIPPEIQEAIADQIEQYIEPLDMPAGALAGSMPDLPDDAEETLLRWRRESVATPPLADQLGWLEDE